MKLLIVTAAVVALQTASAWADQTSNVGSCYVISNQDERNYCRAKIHKESSICYAIQNQRVRVECLAETK